MSAPITAITMPKWGLTMTEGKVVQWLKQPGASFAPGDELLEIETSKITNVVEADAAGTMMRIVAPEGTDVADRCTAGGDRGTGNAGRGHRCIRRAVRRGRTIGYGDGRCDADRAARGASAWSDDALSRDGQRRRCTAAAAARFRRRSEHLDVQPARTVRRPPRRWHWSCRGTDSPARTWAPAMPRCSLTRSKPPWRRSMFSACMSSGIRWAGLCRCRSRRGDRSASRR